MTRLPRILAETIERQTGQAEWTPKEAVKIRRLSLAAYKLGLKHGAAQQRIRAIEEENAAIDEDLARNIKEDAA